MRAVGRGRGGKRRREERGEEERGRGGKRRREERGEEEREEERGCPDARTRCYTELKHFTARTKPAAMLHRAKAWQRKRSNLRRMARTGSARPDAHSCATLYFCVAYLLI
jgi:hypothetical protein